MYKVYCLTARRGGTKGECGLRRDGDRVSTDVDGDRG